MKLKKVLKATVRKHDSVNDGALLYSNGQLRTERYGDRERMSNAHLDIGQYHHA